MLKQARELILFLSALLLVFTSCKKSKTNTDVLPNTISASIDGTITTFNVGARATVLPVTGGYGISIEGNKKELSASQTNLSFSIVSPSVITPKTYVENSGGNPLIAMNYFYDVAFGVGTTSSNYGSTTNPVTVTIPEINSTYVKGTFSGELLYNDLNGNPGNNLLSSATFYVHF